MQVSEWTYCSNKSLPPILSCSRYGFVASASFNLLTIYRNTATGLKPISSSKAFEKPITTISWCNFYDSESILPLYLLIGFDNGHGILLDIPKFSIISNFSLSESAVTSSEWSNIHSNHFFVGCQNGDLISAYFAKSTENEGELHIVISWATSCAFPVEQLHVNHNDCQMLMIASNQGKFAIYDQIYDDSPMRLFTGTFEEEEEENLPKNLVSTQNSISASNNNLNLSSNATNSISSSTFFDNINQKSFVQCGFHPHVNDIFYFASQSRIFYGFIKEQKTVSLFPSSSFIRIVGVFFPPSDENSIVVIQRPSILLLSYSINKSWKRLCEVPNFNNAAVSFADCKFEKNSFIVASRGNNLSVIKFHRRKLFYSSFMRNLVNKPSKIAVNNSFYAFIVKNPKTHTVGPNINNYFLYLAPQLTCMTNLCLVYNINFVSNCKRNYFITSNSQSFQKMTNEILYITQMEWVSDTDLIFAARCEDNKHKLFFFNYKRRELISILKPQLEFMFLDKQFESRLSVGKPISTNSKNSDNQSNNSDNSNINLFESLMEEVGLNPVTSSSSNFLSNTDLSQSILVSSTYNFTPSSINPSFSNYYTTLINNDLSIRLHVHRNQKYFAATIGNYALEIFITSQSNNPKPLLFEDSSVVILPEPCAVSFIDDSNEFDKIALFYKDHIDICCIEASTDQTSSSSSPNSPQSSNAMSFELVNKYEYHSELKSIPILAHSFTETFHIVVLESGEIEIIKIKSDNSFNRKLSLREIRKMSTDSTDIDNNVNTRKMSVDSYHENESSLSTEPSENKDDNYGKLSAFSEFLGKMQKVSCLRVSDNASTCMVFGKQPRAENVAFISLSNSGKSKISFPKSRIKRCDYISNSIIFVNVFGSRCFTFCSIDDRKPIDTPHHSIKSPTNIFENLKMQIIKELTDNNGIKKIASTSYLNFDSQTIPINNNSYFIGSDNNNNLSLSESNSSFSSSFGSSATNEEIDFSSSSDEIIPIQDSESNTKTQIKKSNEEKEEVDDESESESEDENKKQKDKENETVEKHSENLKLKTNKTSNVTSGFDSTMSNSAINSSEIDLSSNPTVSSDMKVSAISDQQTSSSSPILLPKDSLVDVSFVSHLADKLGLFYISDLLQSVGQKYDPLCYGINLNENSLIYYLRSFSQMLGESQPQPLNRRQAIYQKLTNDIDGTLSRLLTVGRTDESNHTKNMLKIALSTMQLNEENFQMMLDVLLESGLDEDVTDILFFSGKYDYRSIERFVISGELEFAILATRLLLKTNEKDSDETRERKQKEVEKAVSLIVNFYNEHNRKHQIVPFLLGMRRFEEAAKYLDKYGESKCASVVRSLVASKIVNGKDAKILLDYSKLPSI